jgi:hypothetical protein
LILRCEFQGVSQRGASHIVGIALMMSADVALFLYGDCMQYLLMDAHSRFLGTFTSQKLLAVGDIFQNTNAKTYAVVGMNWNGQGSESAPSITVMPVNMPAQR